MKNLVLLGVAACVHPPIAGHAMLATPSPGARTIAIDITVRGFEPDSIDVESGETATIVFTRRVQHTCVKRVVVALDDGHGNVERDLPIGTPVAITLTFDRIGELGFSCAMAMQGGAIHVLARDRARSKTS